VTGLPAVKGSVSLSPAGNISGVILPSVGRTVETDLLSALSTLVRPSHESTTGGRDRGSINPTSSMSQALRPNWQGQQAVTILSRSFPPPAEWGSAWSKGVGLHWRDVPTGILEGQGS
jgi:hypothetical protein